MAVGDRLTHLKLGMGDQHDVVQPIDLQQILEHGPHLFVCSLLPALSPMSGIHTIHAFGYSYSTGHNDTWHDGRCFGTMSFSTSFIHASMQSKPFVEGDPWTLSVAKLSSIWSFTRGIWKWLSGLWFIRLCLPHQARIEKDSPCRQLLHVRYRCFSNITPHWKKSVFQLLWIQQQPMKIFFPKLQSLHLDDFFMDQHICIIEL